MTSPLYPTLFLPPAELLSQQRKEKEKKGGGKQPTQPPNPMNVFSRSGADGPIC